MEERKGGARDGAQAGKQKLFTCKVQTLVGNPTVSGCNDGAAEVATLENPADVLCSSDRKMVCFCDLGSHSIRVYDIEKRELKTIFGSGAYGSEDGDPLSCAFAFPHGLAFSEDESIIYVTDTNNHSIRCLDLQKQHCSTLVGEERKRGTAAGTLEETLLAEPRGIATSMNDQLIVSTCSAIYLVDIEKDRAEILAGGELAGFKDGKLEESLFDHPDGVLAINNLVFVADTYNHRIRVIDLDLDPNERSVATYAGTGEAGHNDGPCLKASFKFPQKIRCWADENNKLLYVTELNDSIRVIDLTKRLVFTLAGNLGAFQNGFLDGTGDSCLFNFPYGIDVLDESNIIVSDSDNHSLRVVSITGREEPSKPPKSIEQKMAKPLKKPAAEEAKSATSPAFEMLQNATREAAKKITPSVIEILLSYTGNPARITLFTLLSYVHMLLFNERKRYEVEDVHWLLKRHTVREDILNLRTESVPSQNCVFLNKQLATLKKNDDCRLPGIRVVYLWIVEVAKAVTYFHEKLPAKRDSASSGFASATERKAPEQSKELARLQGMVKEKDRVIEGLREENEALMRTNLKCREEVKQFKDQFLTLMKLLENILDDETIPLPPKLH